MDFRWLPLEEGKEIWDEALGFFPEAPFSLLYGWRQVYESALRLKTFYLLAETGGRVQGLCPLVFMKSPWIGKGNFLISLPYMTRAGLWAVDSECRQAMVQRLIEKALELKAGFVELRQLKTNPSRQRSATRNMSRCCWSCPKTGPFMKNGLPPG